MSKARPPGADGDTDGEYLTIQEAAPLLGGDPVPHGPARQGPALPVFERPVDKRVRWLRRADVQALLEPRPRAKRAA